MKELKQRILQEAQVGEGDIIHVDMFLNHCMDMDLMERMGNELAKRFRGEKITKVLTVESSGIALACFIGRALRVPVIYAKKFQTGYIDPNVYSAETHSFSFDKSYTIRVSKKYLDRSDTVLLVDDILANGQAALALLELVSKSGAEAAGMAVAIEKAMQAGWSTAPDEVRSLGFGAGMGLPNMKKYSDEMNIETEIGVGTTVTMSVNIA